MAIPILLLGMFAGLGFLLWAVRLHGVSPSRPAQTRRQASGGDEGLLAALAGADGGTSEADGGCDAGGDGGGGCDGGGGGCD